MNIHSDVFTLSFEKAVCADVVYMYVNEHYSIICVLVSKTAKRAKIENGVASVNVKKSSTMELIKCKIEMQNTRVKFSQRGSAPRLARVAVFKTVRDGPTGVRAPDLSCELRAGAGARAIGCLSRVG